MNVKNPQKPMKESDNGYHISFFKPTTDRARFNRGIVIWLASIWFIAIFGFHILLRVIEKPTPEPALTAFENVWESVKNGTAGKSELQTFAHSTLSVLGKIAIKEDERSLLSRSMSWSAILLAQDDLRPLMIAEISEFEALKASGVSFNDAAYTAAKSSLAKSFIPVLGLSRLDPLTRILPLELTTEDIASLPAEAVSSLPDIMQKYLVHNQSVLTDTKFLGFPFHYFYTSIFLLILFIGLCWLYCVRSDRRNELLGISD
jgi:putative solute:sodium symporter small subunit